MPEKTLNGTGQSSNSSPVPNNVVLIILPSLPISLIFMIFQRQKLSATTTKRNLLTATSS